MQPSTRLKECWEVVAQEPLAVPTLDPRPNESITIDLRTWMALVLTEDMGVHMVQTKE